MSYIVLLQMNIRKDLSEPEGNQEISSHQGGMAKDRLGQERGQSTAWDADTGAWSSKEFQDEKRKEKRRMPTVITV